VLNTQQLSKACNPYISFVSLDCCIIYLFEFGNFRLKERLGCEPSDEQIADSLRISRADLQSKLIQCSLAREKLAMSNVRLVMSIAQKYDNMGAEMADLVQVTFFASFQVLKADIHESKDRFVAVLLYAMFLMQGGLIGLLRGIEKFDSSKGFKISTYVYWWIRQVRLIFPFRL
jgi:RNA polymerase primary sigma factor